MLNPYLRSGIMTGSRTSSSLCCTRSGMSLAHVWLFSNTSRSSWNSFGMDGADCSKWAFCARAWLLKMEEEVTSAAFLCYINPHYMNKSPQNVYLVPARLKASKCKSTYDCPCNTKFATINITIWNVLLICLWVGENLTETSVKK